MNTPPNPDTPRPPSQKGAASTKAGNHSILIVGLGAMVAVLGMAVVILVLLHLKATKTEIRPAATTNIEPQSGISTEMQSVGQAMASKTKPAVSARQLVDRGSAYARDGDWRQAFDCFSEVVATGDSHSENEWSWAAASALAAGETKTSEEYCRTMMDLFGRQANADAAERCAKRCLCLPGISGALLESAAARADFALTRGTNNLWRQLAKGMAEYRLGNFSEALKYLRQPESTGDFELANLAGCFGAMARHQLGDTAAAQKALDAVSRRLKLVVQTGYPPNRDWENWARALAVRAEAERLILGREVSPPLNPSDLVAGRRKWQSVAKWLDSAEQLAKAGQWPQASETYAMALADPAFDWGVSELKQDSLSLNMAVVFLMAGDTARHSDLSRALLDRDLEQLAPVMQERYAKAILTTGGELPPELKKRGLALARRACEIPGAEQDSWLSLLRGLADYRDGKYEDAIASLTRVQFPNDPVTQARLLLIRAMACHRVGRTEQAVQAAQAAQTTFASNVRGAGWLNAALYQLAMKELLTFMAAPGGPGKPR